MVDYFSWTDALPAQPESVDRAPDPEAPERPAAAAIDDHLEPHTR